MNFISQPALTGQTSADKHQPDAVSAIHKVVLRKPKKRHSTIQRVEIVSGKLEEIRLEKREEPTPSVQIKVHAKGFVDTDFLLDSFQVDQLACVLELLQCALMNGLTLRIMALERNRRQRRVIGISLRQKR